MASSVTVNMAVGGLNNFKNDMEKAKSYAGLLDQAKLDNFSKQLDKIETGAKKVLTSIANMAKGLWNAEVDAAKWADDIATMSRNYGVGVEQLQRWQLAAQLVDVQVTDLLNAQTRMTTKMKDSNKEAQWAFEQLGVSVKNSNGEYRDANEVFWEAVEAIGKMGDTAEAGMIASTLFGRTYKELTGLFMGGRAAWEQAGADAQIISEDDINALVEASDAYDKLQQSWEATKLQLFANLAPAFKTIAESLNVLSNSIGEWLKTDEGRAAISAFGDAIAGLVTSFTDEDASKIFESIKTALQDLTGALQWLADNGETVIKVVGGLAAAFAGIKVGTNVLSFVNAIKTLVGGGASSAAGSLLTSAGTAAGAGTATSAGAAAGAGTAFSSIASAASAAAPFLAVAAPFAALAALAIYERGRDKQEIEQRKKYMEYAQAMYAADNTSERGYQLAHMLYYLSELGNIDSSLGSQAAAEEMQKIFSDQFYYDAAMNVFGEGSKEMEWLDAILNGTAGNNLPQMLGDLVYNGLDKVIAMINTQDQQGKLTETGTTLAGDIVQGVISMEQEAAAAGASVAAACIAAFNAASAAAFGGGAGTTTNTYNNGGNIYVGTMNMPSGADAGSIIAAARAQSKKVAAGYGG